MQQLLPREHEGPGEKLRMRTVTQFLTSSLCQLPSPCPNNRILVPAKNYARLQFLGFRSTLASQISPTADLLVLVFIFSVTDESDKVQTKEKEARHERSWSRPRNNQPKVNLEVNPAPEILRKAKARCTKKCEQSNICLCCTSNQHLQRCPIAQKTWKYELILLSSNRLKVGPRPLFVCLRQ